MPATAPWLASAEALLNRNISASSAAAALAQRLDGSSLLLDIEGMTKILIAMHGGTVSLLNGADTAAADADSGVDARIAGSAPALLQMLRSGGSPAARSSVQISGNAETANLYREFFMAARPDFEEELSRFIGDLAARRVSRMARGFAGWARRMRRTVGENISEYLQEEGRDLVNGTELAEYLQGVDSVREAADRIEARLVRLELLSKGNV